MRQKNGFTLIELLVVISVIGVLTAVLMAGFTTSQKRSRDVKRRADLLSVQKSLEQCYVLTSSYPATVDFGGALDCGGQTTMNIVPLDPKNDGSQVYVYTVNSDLDTYCLCGRLEQAGSGNANSTGVNGSCSFSTGDYLCVSAQQ